MRRRLLMASGAFAFALIATSVAAQARPSPSLDSQVVTAVDRLYPGFLEILESGDPSALATLSRTLVANPSPESLAVLLWMLQYGPSWSAEGAAPHLQIANLVRATGRLPLTPLIGALQHTEDEQRIAAVNVLTDFADQIQVGEFADQIQPGQRAALEKALITALSDRNVRMREFVAQLLRVIGSANARAALARAVQGDDVTDMFYWLATAQKRPFPPGRPTTATFPQATVAAVSAVAPDFLATLQTLDDQRVRQLFEAMGTTTNPDAIPVLMWLLGHGDMRAYGSMIVERLSQPQVIAHLPLGELASILASGRPDHRLEAVGLVAGILQYRGTEMAATVRSRAIELLTASLKDRNPDVRLAAAQGLGTAQPTTTVSFLLSTLNRPGLPTYEASVVINALASIGDPAALPALARLASSSRSIEVRESAVRGYLAIAKPSDPAREARRLLWEQPDTSLETSVLAQGRAALPLAWRALATGSRRERRAAAALLGWVRDRRSIQPILAALAQSPGALTKQQLLFDLNMILLTEGGPLEAGQRNDLAAKHLRWLYDQLARERIDSDIRSAVLACKTIRVHPQRVVSPFSIELSSTTPGDGRGQPSRPVSATAQTLESPQAFLESMAKEGCGVAFHSITAAEGVARVATTLYLARGRIANQVWSSLYRNEGDTWVSLQAPSHPVLHRMLNEPNLLPTVNRNYGMDDPLKILRLDLTMERIRVDLKASEYLRSENRGIPGRISELDASYVPLLERYRISESPAVRYTAELESLKLTNQPEFEVWIEALTRQRATPFRAMAQQVLATYSERAFERGKGEELAGNERAELIAAAVQPQPVDAALPRRPLPQAESIRQVQRSGRFGLISVVTGSGPRAQSGYSMLFDRRGDRWVFLCVVRSWIS